MRSQVPKGPGPASLPASTVGRRLRTALKCRCPAMPLRLKPGSPVDLRPAAPTRKWAICAAVPVREAHRPVRRAGRQTPPGPARRGRTEAAWWYSGGPVPSPKSQPARCDEPERRRRWPASAISTVFSVRGPRGDPCIGFGRLRKGKGRTRRRGLTVPAGPDRSLTSRPELPRPSEACPSRLPSRSPWPG